ncbi:MAG: 30S ribosomal protein S3 [Candidatus Nomurabacteria bacterium]|nr:30S ribosomal protein S3 [Candidatus Nomurabacteria bacterium]
MSKVVHPYAQRLGIIRGWKSRWFGIGKKYSDQVVADELIRGFLEKELQGKYVAEIDIERSRKTTRIVLATSRPGMVIGRQGEGAQKMKKDLIAFMRKNQMAPAEEFVIDVIDVENPDANAAINAQAIREMLEKRMQFRRVLKMTAEKIKNVRGVKGVKIVVAGRLGGAEMARREEVKLGGIPLQFLRGDVDYATETARLPYGGIGIKVWVYKGDTLGRESDNK